jgi:hypothetical protein
VRRTALTPRSDIPRLLSTMPPSSFSSKKRDAEALAFFECE